MSIIDFNANPSSRQLRQFGLITTIALPAITYLLCGRSTAEWSSLQTNLMALFTTAGILAGLLGWFKPAALKPLFLAAMIATYPIGLVVSELILLALFLLVFTPFAMVFRLIGRDALKRKIDPDADTYWQPKDQPQDAASYYRQS